MNLYTKILPIVKDISPFPQASAFFSLHLLSGFLITEQYFRIVSSLFPGVNPLSTYFQTIFQKILFKSTSGPVSRSTREI